MTNTQEHKGKISGDDRNGVKRQFCDKKAFYVARPYACTMPVYKYHAMI